MLAYKEWFNLFHEGKLNDIQSQFFLPRPAEALFDLEKDPHETKNLANAEEHKITLANLREILNDHIISQTDLSFFPEPYFLENGIENPIDFGKKNKTQIKNLIEIANLSLLPYENVSRKISDALENKDPWIKYWGLIVCSSFGLEAKEQISRINSLFENLKEENLVRIRALEYLLLNNFKFDESKMLDLIKNPKDSIEGNLMLNTLALYKTKNPNFKLELNKNVFPNNWFERENALMNRRMNYLTENE